MKGSLASMKEQKKFLIDILIVKNFEMSQVHAVFIDSSVRNAKHGTCVEGSFFLRILKIERKS